MTAQQALLISLLLGRALDAILVQVSEMKEAEVDQAIKYEEARTDPI